MRRLINLLAENADEYSTKGHAGMKVRQNDPRFGDNPMRSPEEDEFEELDEFVSDSTAGLAKMDRLHDIFKDAEVSDQEIKQGIQLSNAGMHKVAAALGTSPEEIRLLMSSLTQHLRDRDNNADDESLREQYRRFIEAEETTPARRPFDDDADLATDPDRLSAESDYLGDVTVRSSKLAKSKFYQGSKAAGITSELDAAHDDAQKQAILRPLIEDDEAETGQGFADEINSDSGSYNFPWKLDGRSGFGTMTYSVVGGKPSMRLISIRDVAGDDVDADSHMRHELLKQARNFIPDA